METRFILMSFAFVTIVADSACGQFITNFGIKIGATVSNISVKDITPINVGGQLRFVEFVEGNSINPSIGIFADMLTAEHFGLQTEITYMRLGASKTYAIPVTTANEPDGTGTIQKVTAEVGLKYLQLRIAARPKYTLGKTIIYADIGPTFSYLLGADNLFSDPNRVNSLQAGYGLGGGVNLGQLLEHDFFIELKYSGDFRYFYNHPNAKLWNQSWMICVGTTL